MTKEQIKNWLEKTGRSRAWLAQECGVAKATVDGWLSAGRPIPDPALKILQRLIYGAEEINPVLPLRDFLAAQEIARRSGLTLDQWLAALIRKTVTDCRTGFGETSDPLPSLLVAEDDEPPKNNGAA